jgi:hypothetical protein
LNTGRDVTTYILPLLREHSVRFVQVGRHGAKEADGITILSDTRKPDTLYIKGDYKLSDELAASGVVPSCRAHICSLKSKCVPIETWLDTHYDNRAFGYNGRGLMFVGLAGRGETHLAVGLLRAAAYSRHSITSGIFGDPHTCPVADGACLLRVCSGVFHVL